MSGNNNEGSTYVGNIDAKIGPITFKDEFSDPTVNINHRRETADHQIISGTSVAEGGEDFVVQEQGRKPPEIEVIGWLTENQVPLADKLVAEHIIPIQTARYVGTAVPDTVDVDYSRVYHNEYNWLFETTFTFLGVENVFVE